jgi:methionyl-tRNA formyltransferase
MDKRIVILAVDCDASNILINELQKEYPLATIIYEQPISKKILIKNRIKKLGLSQTIGQLLFIVSIPKILKVSSAKRIKEILLQNELDNSPVKEKDRTQVSSVNSNECIFLLQSIKPDIVILSGTRIISQNVLNSIDADFINIHAGITPLYRGVHGAYWALVEDSASLCGVTLHYVDKGIDTGKVIAQSIIQPLKKDNFITYGYLQTAAGIRLLKEKLPSLLQKNAQTALPLTNQSKLRYHPTLFGYIKNYLTKGIK